MSSLISIIIPVYNVEKYIRRCVDSILVQTYDNLEIILVDDGSTDGCPDICDEYVNRDSRIAVIHKQNGGSGYARNSGLEKSSGEFVMFVDSDDYLSEDAVEVLYDRMMVDGSDIAVGKHTDVYEDGRADSTYCSWITDSVYSAREILSKMGDDRYIPVAAWGKLYRRKILSNVLYPSLKCGEDLWIYPYIIEKCNYISVVNKTMYYYLQRPGSITYEKSERVKHDELDTVLHIVRYFYDNGYEACSRKWYAKAISRAVVLKKRRNAVNLFSQYFPRYERKQLLKKQSIKTRIKWVALFVPAFFTVVRYIKKITGVANHGWKNKSKL